MLEEAQQTLLLLPKKGGKWQKARWELTFLIHVDIGQVDVGGNGKSLLGAYFSDP